MSDPNNYTIGWISAIEIEYIAAQAFLDERHKGPRQVHRDDANHYTLGRIGNHNVVITVLPRGDNGVAAAALAAKDMMHSFANVRVCLMVGIGGGAPSKRHDIRLGDVVVSIPTFSAKSGNLGGVIQYDYGRTIQTKKFESVKYMNQPDKALRNAANGLSAKYKSEGNNIDAIINDILKKNEKLRKEYSRPDPDSDKLYSSDPVQTSGADENLAPELIERPKRSEEEDNPAIHYGLIASADSFMEDAQIRDILAEQLDVLCFEMEAAGLMNNFPCLVIRGICDYSDKKAPSFKGWRGYAAMTAAAYAKALLEMVPAREVNTMKTINDLVPPDLVERARNFFWGDKKKEAVSVSVIADPEETQTKDTSKDQPFQMPPTPMQSPIMGSVEPKETQAKDSGKDQPYQMPPSQTATPSPATNDFTSSQTEIEHVYIAVMGVTGAGKSSLISRCTGKNVKIGQNLESCTADVEDVEFMLNDRVCVHLIDTPGFDDTSRSDVEVLQNIAVWLTDSLQQDIKLSGIIYLHRIIDVRMAGSTLRSLSMFKKLCGEDAYSSVVLATSMWSQVDEATGAQRERELIETKKFWGYMHDKGSKIFRLNQTRESCLEIIKYILSLGSTTLLELQDEIVNQGRQIRDTEAGVQLNEDIIHERKKHEAELLAVKTQMQEEIVKHDVELQRALKEEYDELKENIRRSDEEQAKLKQDLKDVYERKERELLELKRQMEENQKDALRRQAEQHENRIRLTEERNREQKEALEKEALEKEALEKEALEKEALEKEALEKEALEKQAQEDARIAKAWAERRETSLHLAAREGKTDVVQKLLTQGARIEAKDKDGQTPLLHALLSGKADTAKLLLDRGANIEATRNDDLTHLQVMIGEGHADMVKFLLDHGVDVTQGKVGCHALVVALATERTDMFELLLDRGANMEVTVDDRSWTIFHVAAVNGNANTVSILLSHGANLEAQAKDGSTPFGVAVWHRKWDMAKLLLDRGANIEARWEEKDWTILHATAANGKEDMVKFLLEHGTNLEAKAKDGSTPFGVAVWHRQWDMAKLLLDRGANIEARWEEKGWTELHATAANGKEDMVKFLLEHGAYLEAKASDGSTPFHLALEHEKADVAQLLLSRGANIEAQLNDVGSTALHAAAFSGEIEPVKFLLDNGADIEAKMDGVTPLCLAIGERKINIANLLLNRGANIEARQTNNGDRIIHGVAWLGKVDMVRFVLDHGANIEAEKDDGSTALSLAVSKGHADVAKLLRARGARG